MTNHQSGPHTAGVHRGASRICRTLVLCAWWLLVAPVAAQPSGDANCDDRADASDLTAVIEALFEGSPCIRADVNDDGVVSAADLPAVIGALGQSATPTPTPTFTASDTPTSTPGDGGTPIATTTPADTPSTTPTGTTTATPTETAPPTPTPTPSSTPTATLVLCPTEGAEVVVSVDNRTGTDPIGVTVSGRRVVETCRNTSGLDEIYAVSGAQSPQSITHLAPGVWVHALYADAPATGRRQYQTSLLLAGAGVNPVGFTAFASVATVRTAIDALGVGSLRDALAAADAAPKPLLIQFDEQAFPPGVPTVIVLTDALPKITTTGVTLDGIDASGAAGNRVIDAGGQPIPVLSIGGASNTVTGLRLRNTGANNRDVLSISGPGAQGNLVDRCIIEQSATADGIGIDDNAGADFTSTANVVRNSEISTAADKGIKVTTNAYAVIENNWVHDNANGGIQATLSGHILARDNVVERSVGASAQNGFSVNSFSEDSPSIASELETDGNISRFNGANGVSVRGLSRALLKNDYYAANGSSGLRVFDDQGMPPASARVEGSTAACNQADGAVVADHSEADFGGGALGSPGNNAFTQNNLPGGFANLRNATAAVVSAVNNQWEHCGRDTVCSDVEIAAYDLSDHGVRTVFAPAQAHRSLQAPVATSVRPAKSVGGDLLRIFGSGFNVIDGHAAGDTCADVAARNHCVPLRGNCVLIGGAPAPIEAVTPTMLVVRLPASCVGPQSLTVQTQGGGVSAPLTVCTQE